MPKELSRLGRMHTVIFARFVRIESDYRDINNLYNKLGGTAED